MNFICLTILILGYKFYSPFVAKQAGLDSTVDTPQKRFSEGVDYVAIHPVRAFLIQFLNNTHHVSLFEFKLH